MSIGYLNGLAEVVSSGKPIDVIRSLQIRLNALPFYVYGYKIWGTNDKDSSSRIDEKSKIIEFPRSINSQYAQAWVALRSYVPSPTYPPHAGATVKETIAAVASLMEVYKVTNAETVANTAQTAREQTAVAKSVASHSWWTRLATPAKVGIGAGAVVGALLLLKVALGGKKKK